MALTAEAELRTLEIDQSLTHQVYATADVFYSGALLEKDIDTGLVSPLGVAGSGAYFIGYCEKTVTTAASSSTEVAVNNHGDVLQGVSVTGVTGASDETKIVYCTTDDVGSDSTLSRAGTDALPIGRVQKWITSTTCDVKLFTEQESKEFALRGAGRRTECLGYTDMNTVANGDVFTNVLTLYGIGKIVGFYAIVGTATTDAAADATLNLEIGTTNLTGGAITLGDTGDTTGMEVKGSRVDSASITGANTFGDGDTLSVEASSVTDYTDGAITLFVVIEQGA